MTMYKSEVVSGKKLYKLFAMDFMNSHHHTDRLDAAGLNEHRKNLGILRGILFTRKDLLVRFSETGKPDDGLMKDLLHLYYTTEAPPPGRETVDTTTFRSLLEGKLTVPLTSRNNRMLAYLFDQLCRHGFILPRWQNLLEQAGSILGPKGNKPLRHEQFSNALTHARNTPNSMQKKILECVQQVQKQLSNEGTASK